MMSALFGDKGSTFLASSRSDHGETGGSRKLHGRKTNSSSSAMNQNRFSRFAAATLKQSAVRRSIWHAERGSLRKRNSRRQMMDARFFTQRKFRRYSGDRAIRVNPITNLETF